MMQSTDKRGQKKVNTKNDEHKSAQNFWWISIGLFLFTCLIYANTIGHGFVLDDPLAISLNKNVTSGLIGIGDLLSGSYREANFGGQFYRPISLIQFAIEWEMMPDNPAIHHFFNVVWYALTVVLVFWVIKKWMSSLPLLIPILIAIFFAIHPIHTEVVANIKSRDEIMSLLFLISAFLTWDIAIAKNNKTYLRFTVILYFLSILSKETAITMFPIFGFLCWGVYRQDLKVSILRGLIFAIPVLVIFLIRFALFYGETAPSVDIMDNPIVSATGLGQHLATSILILWKYLSLLFVPYPLSSDYSYIVIPLTEFSDLRVWLGILTFGAMLVYGFRKFIQRAFIGIAILSFLLSLSLFSQLLMTIGTMFGERLAYLSSFWFVSGVVYLTYSSMKSLKFSFGADKLFVGLYSPIALVFLFITVNRNQAWESNYSLFTTDVQTYPMSVRLNNGAAEETVKLSDLEQDLVKKQQLLDRAEAYCNQIMQVKPVATAYLTLGNIRMRQKQYKEAINFYRQVNDLKAIVDKSMALAYRELGREAGQIAQDIPTAQQYLMQSIQLNPIDAETWYILGVSYGVSGNHMKAAEQFDKAYQLKSSLDYAKNAMNAYRNSGNASKFEEFRSIVENQ